MNVVISQPMLFPWIGLIEQVRLSDTFVFYDDVQFSKGSFTNRVQIKTSQGMCWMTVPIEKTASAMAIKDIKICYKQNWQNKHFKLIEQSLAGAMYLKDALYLLESVYAKNHKYLGELAKESITAVVNYFDLLENKKIINVGDIKIPGTGSDRVLAVVKSLGGNAYISGHGGLKYLKHLMFDDSQISVKYMEYKLTKYRQLHGEFTPYVSILDLIANCGKTGKNVICSDAKYYKEL